MYKHGCFTLLLLFSQLATAQTVVEVFTEMPAVKVTSISNQFNVTYFDLDQPNRTAKKFPRFANNETTAKGQFDKWRATTEGQRAVNSMKSSYAPYLKAAQYELTQLPAIVFEKGRYVVYGTYDIKQALNDYIRFKRKQP